MKNFLIVGMWTVLTLCSALAESGIEMPLSRVSLTYPEFRQLFDAAHRPPLPQDPEPTIAFVAATYELDLQQDQRVVVAQWLVENFTATRRLISVAPDSLGVAPAPDNDAVFLSQDGCLAVLAKNAGVQAARVCFAPQSTDHGDGRSSMQFPILPAATNLLLIRNVPPHLRITVKDSSPLPAPEGERHFALATSKSDVHLIIEEKRPVVPSQWEWRSEAIVTVGDVGLQFRVRLLAALLSGDGLEMHVPLPLNIRGLRPISDGLTSWKIGSENKDHPVLVLNWNDRASGERTIELHYDIPTLVGAETWWLAAPDPTLPGADNTFAILHSPSVELSGKEGVIQADRVPLSDWMRTQVNGRDVTVFRAGGTTEVSVTWLPLAEPANLVVRSAKYETQLVLDGSQLTEATVEVECESATRWEVELPVSAKLLRCFVNGRTVRPIQRANRLEVPLTAELRGEKQTITFSYTDKTVPLDPVAGGLTLALPVTDAFTHSLGWSLRIPENYEMAGIESNAQVLPSQTKSRLEMTQQLIHGKPLVAEVFYRKRGLDQ